MKLSLKTILPHLVALLLFVVLPSIYFSPLYTGYALKQNDIRQFQGMSKEIFDYKLTHENQQPYWTNAMFSGMPAYQISVEHNANWLTKIDQVIKLGLPRPVGVLFISMLGFYILGLCLRVNPWLSMVGALGYGFSTINILYLGAGHMSKVNAIAYMAPALGGLILAFRGKWLLGSAVFALFLGLNITANHLQMTYYLSFLLGAVALAEVIRLSMAKEFKPLLNALGGLTLASTLALLSNASLLSTTLEYSKATTRGSSELTIKPANGVSQTKDGLSDDYILQYNYGPKEWLSLYAPNAKGGKQGPIANDPTALENTDASFIEQVGQMDHYWGGQSASGGAFYFGVVMLIFFILGLIFVKDTLRWPFLALSILALFLASNEMNFLNDFFIHKFPMYNKFRDSKMILVLLQIMIPTMGIMLLDKLMKKEGGWPSLKYWYTAIGVLIFGGLLLLTSPQLSGEFVVKKDFEPYQQYAKKFNDSAQMVKGQLQALTQGATSQTTIDSLNSKIEGYQNNEQYINNMTMGLRNPLADARIGIYKSDMQRSLFLVILALGIIVLFLRTKMNSLLLLAITGVLVLSDQISVSKRYLNNKTDEVSGDLEAYQTLDQASVPYAVSRADMSILESEKPNSAFKQQLLGAYANFDYYKNLNDQATLEAYAAFGALNLSSNYRVLNLNNVMAETNTSFFHKSIGGYHGAKLKRYQEFYDFHFEGAYNAIIEALNKAKNEKFRSITLPVGYSQAQLQQVFDTLKITEISLQDAYLNMLNTKYIISDPKLPAIKNSNANGEAWFVSEIETVDDYNQEMLASGFDSLDDSKKRAVVNKEFKNLLSGIDKDTTARIKMINYDPSEIRYQSNSKTKQLAIFSEIYFPDGWNCYIDGKKIKQTLRANYLLRAAVIPAGNHRVEWKFEPYSIQIGTTLSMLGSTILILGFLVVVGFTYRKKENLESEPQK